MSEREQVWGVVAEFDSPEGLIEATRRAYAAGYRQMDAYSPYPIEELPHLLHDPPNRLPLITLIAGITGGIGAYGLQYWSAVIAYPMEVGGRPIHSWPSFIPVTFESVILFAGVACVVGLIVTCGLPMLYHPLFNVSGFENVSRDGFFLCIEARDPIFDREGTRGFMEGLRARKVSEVEP